MSAPASFMTETDDRPGDTASGGADDLEELRANARARRRQSHLAAGRHPCAARRQRRRQVDAVARDFRSCPSRWRRDPVSRRAARRPQPARGARRGHRHGHAGDEPRAGPLGFGEHFPPRSRPAGPPVAPDDAPAGERNSGRPRTGAGGLARRGGARSFRRAAPARRNCESAGAQSQSHHFRRADSVLEPERGRAALRCHRAARKRAMRDRLRLSPSGGSVRDLRRDHSDARGAHGRGLAADVEPEPDGARAPDGRPRSWLNLRALLRFRSTSAASPSCPFGRCARPRWCATSPSICIAARF